MKKLLGNSLFYIFAASAAMYNEDGEVVKSQRILRKSLGSTKGEMIWHS